MTKLYPRNPPGYPGQRHEPAGGGIRPGALAESHLHGQAGLRDRPAGARPGWPTGPRSSSPWAPPAAASCNWPRTLKPWERASRATPALTPPLSLWRAWPRISRTSGNPGGGRPDPGLPGGGVPPDPGAPPRRAGAAVGRPPGDGHLRYLRLFFGDSPYGHPVRGGPEDPGCPVPRRPYKASISGSSLPGPPPCWRWAWWHFADRGREAERLWGTPGAAAPPAPPSLRPPQKSAPPASISWTAPI